MEIADFRTQNPETDSRLADWKSPIRDRKLQISELITLRPIHGWRIGNRKSEITNHKFRPWPRSLKSPAESQFHSHDAVGVADAEERDVFTEGILKLDNLVL